MKIATRVFDEMSGWLGKCCTQHVAIFQLQAFIYGDSYLPAPTFETKKFLNVTCRGYGKLHLSCSEFFRAAIGSTRKQLRTCVHQLFDEMRLNHGKKMHMLSCILTTSCYKLRRSVSSSSDVRNEKVSKRNL